MTDTPAPRRDKPWMFRTYAGHSTASESNKLYRSNLAKGQTGLSIAFDLPTQTGYDSDHLARGEVGKVGVPISHLGDMRALFEGIPLDADEHLDDHQRHRPVADGPLYRRRRGTGRAAREAARHDAERHHQGISVARLLCLPAGPVAPADQDLILFTTKDPPKWNPMNVCSYHLQEAGATPEQELAYALATAFAVLDDVKKSGELSPKISRRWSAESRFSSTPASASSPNSARCAPSPNFGMSSSRRATA